MKAGVLVLVGVFVLGACGGGDDTGKVAPKALETAAATTAAPVTTEVTTTTSSTTTTSTTTTVPPPPDPKALMASAQTAFEAQRLQLISAAESDFPSIHIDRFELVAPLVGPPAFQLEYTTQYSTHDFVVPEMWNVTTELAALWGGEGVIPGLGIRFSMTVHDDNGGRHSADCAPDLMAGITARRSGQDQWMTGCKVR